MKVPSAASIFIVLMAGCASQPIHSKAASEPLKQEGDHASPPSSVSKIRVALPYTFTRHGVEIRVNSLESANNQVLVSVTLQETRGQAGDLQLATLMQVFTSADQTLPYVQYIRAEQLRKDSTIHLSAREQFSITLYYQATSGGPEAKGGSLELRFPTGKYWNSHTTKE